MEVLRKEARKLADSTKLEMGLGDVDQHNRSIMQAIDRSGARPAEPAPAEAPVHKAETDVDAPKPVTHPA